MPTPTPTSNRPRLQSLARQTGGDAAAAGQDLAPALQRVSRDLDSYYVLTFTSNERERRPIPQRSSHVEPARCAGARAIRLLGAAAERVADDTSHRCRRSSTTRALKRSPLIDSWFGLTVEPDGRRRVIFTWTPAPAPAAARTGQPRGPTSWRSRSRRRRARCCSKEKSGRRVRGTCRVAAARQRSVPDDSRTAPVRSDHPAGRRHQARCRARRTSTCRTCAARRR